MRTKHRTGFYCPKCGAKLVVPQNADGSFSSDLWRCSNVFCRKVWTADQIDDFRRSQQHEPPRGKRP